MLSSSPFLLLSPFRFLLIPRRHSQLTQFLSFSMPSQLFQGTKTKSRFVTLRSSPRTPSLLLHLQIPRHHLTSHLSPIRVLASTRLSAPAKAKGGECELDVRYKLALPRFFLVWLSLSEVKCDSSGSRSSSLRSDSTSFPG